MAIPGTRLYGIIGGVPTLAIYAAERHNSSTDTPVHLLAVSSDDVDRIRLLASSQVGGTAGQCGTAIIAVGTIEGLRLQHRHGTEYRNWGTYPTSVLGAKDYLTPRLDLIENMIQDPAVLPLVEGESGMTLELATVAAEMPAEEATDARTRAAAALLGPALAQPSQARTGGTVPFGGSAMPSESGSLGVLRSELEVRQQSLFPGSMTKPSPRLDPPARTAARPALAAPQAMAVIE